MKKLNVNIIFEEDNIETKDMQDEMIVTFHNCLSEEESRAISRRIRWGLQKRWEMGAYITASAPYVTCFKMEIYIFVKTRQKLLSGSIIVGYLV